MDQDELVADERVQREVATMRAVENNRALSVVIMGQTGVGKSSLLNALFATTLKVGDIQPTTKLPEPVRVEGSRGHHLVFWDMPGFGESTAADADYLEMYRAKLVECDVVLWAMHADSRSTTFDLEVLSQLLGGAVEETRRDIMSKLTFVLTKADVLAPPAWIYLMNGRSGSFTPSQDLDAKLGEKAAYFESAFLRGQAESLVSRTFGRPGSAGPADDRLVVDGLHVEYRGYFDDAVHQELGRRHPDDADLLDRLRDNHRVIVCSAAFRFGLAQLLSVVVNKIGVLATGRFERLVGDGSSLEELPVATVKKKGAFVIWDARRGRMAFDLDDVKL